MKRLVLVALFLLLLTALVSAGAARSALAARQSLEQGVSRLQLGQAAVLRTGKHRSLAEVLHQVRSPLRAAKQDFSRAEGELAPWGPLLHLVGLLPGLSDAGNAVPASRVAAATTAGVLQLLQGLSHDPPGARAAGTVRRLMEEVPAGHANFTRACQDFTRAAQARHQITRPSLPLQRKLHTIDAALPRLRAACEALPLLPAVLGYQAPRTYFVAYQNRNELRATGGFIGSLSYLHVRSGHISETFRGVAYLDRYVIAPPEPVQLYSYGYWVLRDANWSPDFPTSAQLERFFLRLDGLPDVDGVINVTVQAAVDALRVTGPIYLPEYGRWVSAANVDALAEHYTHSSDVAYGPGHYANTDTERKQFIGIVASHILNQATSLSPDGLLHLAQAMGRALQQGDLLLYFRNPREEALLHHLRLDGAIDPTSSDYLFPVDTNLSFNKLNPYIHKTLSDAVRIRPDRWLDETVKLTVRNTATPNLPIIGIGPGFGKYGGPRDYATFLRFYVPAGAELIDQSGWTQEWSGGAAYGKTMFCGYLVVPHGQSRTVRLHYVVPPNVFAWSHGARYRLMLQHQPGTWFDAVRVRVWHDGRVVQWVTHHRLTRWVRTLPVTPRLYHPIPLPPPRPEVVKVGHWIEPHAFLGSPP